jgi:hypothetical protein
MTVETVITALKSYEAELDGILSRFTKSRDGIHIDRRDDSRVRGLVLELRHLFADEFVDGHRHANSLIAAFNDSIYNYLNSPSYHGVETIKANVAAALARVERYPAAIKGPLPLPAMTPTKNPELLTQLWRRFPLVARQMRGRHDNRPTLDVADEYDVQDLFHAMLTISFDDIRKEEWSPSYAGGSSRMDFLLPELEAVVEIKMMRKTLSTRQLGEELIVDIAKYKKHPQCRTLFCFVYDPEGRIVNPRGVESDLNSEQSEMTVTVSIVPS